MDWLDIETHGLPKKPGQYLVKDKDGKEHPDFCVKNRRGKYEWFSEAANHILPANSMITHYKQNP